MITSDQIPDEVEEAACISRHGVYWYRHTESYREIERASARAAIAAALNAWPENTVEFRRDSYMGWDGNLLILPLPHGGA